MSDALNEAASPREAVEGYLTKTEIARRLRKTPRTVDNWMRRGILPYYKFGKTVAFKWSDVEAHATTHFRVCRLRTVSNN